jgi:hypothetical protein
MSRGERIWQMRKAEKSVQSIVDSLISDTLSLSE